MARVTKKKLWGNHFFYWNLVSGCRQSKVWIKRPCLKLARFLRYVPRKELFSANCAIVQADIPSYSLTLRIGIAKIWNLRIARVGHTHIKWSADYSSMPQAAHVGSDNRPILWIYLFNRSCPVIRPIRTQSFVLGIYLRNLASFKHGRFIQTLRLVFNETSFMGYRGYAQLPPFIFHPIHSSINNSLFKFQWNFMFFLMRLSVETNFTTF
jgi:hypothetical protein